MQKVFQRFIERRKECETLIEVNSTEQRGMRWIALKRESYRFRVKENRDERIMPYVGLAGEAQGV